MSIAIETFVLAERNLRRFAASPRAVIGTLLFPLLLMLIMLAAFSEMVTGVSGGAYIDRLAPLIVLYAAAFGAVNTGLGLFNDLRSGLIDRIRSLPVHRGAALLGRVAADLVRIVAVAALITLVAAAFGFRFRGGLAGVVGFGLIALVVGWMFLWLAVLIALRARTADGVSAALNGPLTLLLFLSTGFAPVEAFPGALQPIVRANPLSVASAAMSGLAGGGPVTGPVLWTLLWAGAVTLVAAPLAIALFGRRGR
ncbi:ABC transporter permease [Nocardia sp. IBHARD005]|uniref:ABC transporter permease n=1 Tax=Nocardia sp. IBHARD005 TaxID=3457765 RepID=UPI0040590619